MADHQHRYVGFVQNVKAVLPTLLTDLYAERKKIKKDMVYEQDRIRHNLLDKRQLAVKVSLNRYLLLDHFQKMQLLIVNS
jgi:DNA polymerase elongation subunit (family B)